jgi:ABC-type lipoprotein release transport system permease subunit
MGLVRGVTPSVRLVRSRVQLEQGDWPQAGEVLVGTLAATKLGARPGELGVGDRLMFEGRAWRISGIFSAAEGAFESEVWCRLDELQQAMKRQDLSLVAVVLDRPEAFADLDLFCKERIDLELQAIRDVDYYSGLQRDYAPVRWLAWLIVVLVGAAGVFAGLNTMYGAVVGRVRELSTLQTIGFVRRAIVASLIQEGVLLAAAATVTAAIVALTLVNGAAIRFTMGAFALRIDGIALLIGCATGLCLGLLGSLPPAARALRLSVAEGLKSV